MISIKNGKLMEIINNSFSFYAIIYHNTDNKKITFVIFIGQYNNSMMNISFFRRPLNSLYFIKMY